MDVSHNIKWQNDVVDAINRSYDHTAPNPDTVPPTARIQQVVRIGDVDAVHQRLLHFLRFQEIDNRYERIALAHQKTFEWIFRTPPIDGDRAKWADFAEWVKGDDPLYWVTGKAGAGKSTLMRYIFDHEHTQKALSSWAADRPLIIASFFFWNSGTDIQMSNEGLLRTLIYQMLEKRPDLSSIAFPHRVEVGILFGQRVLEKNPWSWEELLKAFRVILQNITETSSVMFFIDGLDEFKGVSSDLIDFITSLIVPHTKICASSRPWIAFEDAFNHRPHLRLEDLTYDDIKHYVTTKMTGNAGYEVLRQLDPDYSAQLIENVCTKSEGVFLWVFLVTRSLLEGLSEGERLSDLQARLDSLPSDLEDLFWGILRKLDTFHFTRASQLFQLVRSSLTPLTLLDMSYADEDDSDFALKMSSGTLSKQQAISRAELMRRRISACCKGLLEAHANKMGMLPALPISYLHRTVKDFLEQGDTWEKICEATDDSFNPNLRLYNSKVALLKIQDPNSLSENYFWMTVTYAIEYAARAYSADVTRQVPLLNEIDKVATTLTTKQRKLGSNFLQGASAGAKDDASYWTWTRIDCRPATTFLGLAVQCQLVDYVDATIKARKSPDLEYYSQLLQLAAVHYRVFPNETNRPSVHHNQLNFKLIRLLFSYGANPNYKSDGLTIWEKFLDNWETGDDEYMKAAREFIIHGADPRTSHVTAFYDRFTFELQQLVKQKRKETRWSHYGSKFRRSKGGDDD
jgi:hypothetical protein